MLLTYLLNYAIFISTAKQKAVTPTKNEPPPIKRRYKDMIRTEIKAYTEKEMRDTERKLKETGYTKTNDCMWVKIYTKNNNEIVLTKEY